MEWEAEFVGRESEFNTLKELLEQVRKKRGNILFISGEAGVGKTRLAEELAKKKGELRFEFLSGQCIYHEGTDPYLPFIDMFKGYLTSHPYLASAVQASFSSPANVIFDYYPLEKINYSVAEVSEKAHKAEVERVSRKKTKKPGKKSKGPYTDSSVTIPVSPGIAGTQSQFFDFEVLEGKHRMFETISRIIISISKNKLLVLFIDDVHWADSASLHLLHYLARHIEDQPILVLAAYRTEDLKTTRGPVHPIEELMTRLGSENLFSTLELKRLIQKDTTKIISDLLGVKKIPNDFASLIYQETEGNPFFIKEVLKTLIEDGALSIKKDQLKLNISPDEMVIPMSIRELINLRVQRLTDEMVDVLEYSAVIGNEFEFEYLRNILDLPESKLVNILSKLTEAKFITHIKKDNGFTYQFMHNKIHEVIYNGINEIKKKLIHLRLAKYLEDAKIDNIDEVVYDLAYHFYYGVDFDRALSYSIEGGEKAMRTYANRKALDLYNISLNSLRRLDEKLANTTHYKEKKVEVLMKLGTLNKTMGEWDKALNYFEQAVPICDEISDKDHKAGAYLEMGWIYQQRSFWTQAQSYFRKALAMAEEIQDDYIASEAFNGLGAVAEREGDYEDALEFYATSRKLAEVNDDFLNLAKAHNAFGRIYNLRGDYSKAIKHKEKSIYIFKKLNDLPELAKSYTSLGLTYYDVGDIEKNIECNEKCIKLAEKISDIRIKGYGLTNSVEALVKSNQLEKAEEYTKDALEIFKTLEERYMIALNYANFGIIFKHKKEWNNAIYYFKTAIELMENLNIPYHLAECYKQFAEIYNNRGEKAKADYYLIKAERISQKSLGLGDIRQSPERIRERIY